MFFAETSVQTAQVAVKVLYRKISKKFVISMKISSQFVHATFKQFS